METNYKTLSSLAVEVERAGDLSYAAAVWEKAALVAKTKTGRNLAKRFVSIGGQE